MPRKKMTSMVLAPMIETLSDPVEFRRVFGNTGAQEQVEERAKKAKLIEEFFTNCGSFDLESEEAYDAYKALTDIAEESDFNARLALYVPLNFTYSGWQDVNDSYMRSWMKLIDYNDVRECFNIGDIFEEKASSGEHERVIKCLHLLPWLIENGVLSADTLFMMMSAHENMPLFASCVYDCLEVFEDWGCLSKADLAKLKQLHANFDYRRPHQTLSYTTPERKLWLAEYVRSTNETPVTLHNINGPFSKNLPIMQDTITKATKMLKPGHVILIGGSLAKGYESANSDYDIWDCEISELDRVDPAIVHEIFDTFWISNEPDIEETRAKIVAKYLALPATSRIRRDCLGRMESDLLQFSLMHKGFPYAFGNDLSRALRKFKCIDGGSAFYDIRYRRTAAILYAKYVFLPQL